MLELIDVRIRRGTEPLVTPLNLQVPPGAIHTVMGPSGSGKSTLLAHICGALPPAFQGEGRLRLGGVDLDGLPVRERRVGILFQDDLLFPHMTVLENLLFAVPPGEAMARRKAAEAALADAEVPQLADRNPRSLSGGQRARVALVRALLARPRALLLDEPFSRLDADLRVRFREFVFSHVRERGIPALLVTHDSADVADPERVLRLPLLGGLHD